MSGGSTTHRLAEATYTFLKNQGRFVVNVATHTDPLDVSQYVAAQNAVGWKLEEDHYIPVGSAPAALLLLNVGFSINKQDFTPS